jgi:hypothetical protein
MTTTHQLKRLSILAAVAAVLAFGGRELYYARNVHTSALVIPLSDEQIATAASAVVQGTVARRIGSYRDTDATGELTVYTRWLIQPDRVLKGPMIRSVVVRTEGGRVGLTSVVAEDAAEFSVGDRVFLFLEPSPNSSDLRVVGMFQGFNAVTQEADGTDTATQQGTDRVRPIKDLEALIH